MLKWKCLPYVRTLPRPAGWRRAAWYAGGVALLALAGCGEAAGETSSPPPAAPTATARVPALTGTGPPSATLTLVPRDTPTPLPSATATLGPGSVRAAAVDGMEQVYVPSGEFSMGSAAGEVLAYPDEFPQHAVQLSAYWIDHTEVTNAHFALLVAATGYATMAERTGEGLVFDPEIGDWQKVAGADWQHPRGPGASIVGLEGYPVGQMSWSDAAAYCAWAGRRLPTEAEWEKAARGTDGRPYPWGNGTAGGGLLNYADLHLTVPWADEAADDGYQYFAPVGSYPAGASPYGALDLAGNAWEWVADFFDAGYYARSPYADPDGPEGGTERVLRGGSWWTSARDARVTVRGEAGDFPYDIYGFRCAETAGP